jgi:Mn-dependent DtxR family transcriptional regulator
MDTTEKVLKAMKVAGTPLKGGEIAKLSGLDQKSVDKAMKELKNKGLIISPKKCFWQAT